MADHVFVCYAREDESFVLPLVRQLKERGITIWMDKLNLRPGEDWDYAIDKALYECAAFLLVLSPPPSSIIVPPPPPVLAPTFRNSIGMEFVLIPAGEFRMGSENGEDREQPVHVVRITKPFYLGKYQVTQGQWEAVMGNNPSRFPGDPNRPVERVSWEDTQEFLRRLGEQEGKPYRLPTEAEWEYAVRAGSTGA